MTENNQQIQDTKPSDEQPIINPDTTETVKITKTAEIQRTGLDLLVNGILGFVPTAGMTRLLTAYIYDNPKELRPTQLLPKIGMTRENWYNWKTDKKFMEWWIQVQYDTIALKLPDLYRSLYERGQINDTAAAKLVIQRFDPEFRERSESDQKHTFPGYTPPAQDAINRSKQRESSIIEGKSDVVPEL